MLSPKNDDYTLIIEKFNSELTLINMNKDNLTPSVFLHSILSFNNFKAIQFLSIRTDLTDN